MAEKESSFWKYTKIGIPIATTALAWALGGGPLGGLAKKGALTAIPWAARGISALKNLLTMKRALALGALGSGYVAAREWSSKPPPQQAAQQTVQEVREAYPQALPQSTISPIARRVAFALNKTLEQYGDRMTLDDIDRLLNLATHYMTILQLGAYRGAQARAAQLSAWARIMNNPRYMVGGGISPTSILTSPTAAIPLL